MDKFKGKLLNLNGLYYLIFQGDLGLFDRYIVQTSNFCNFKSFKE